MATPVKTSWFAPKLRSALEQKETSVRGLARAWRPDGDIETTRRSLNRYLHNGIVPSLQIRRELADALDVDASEFEQSEDDEEPSMTFGAAMDAMFNRAVHREVRKILGEVPA